jgi:hypothetical protein
VSKKKPDPRREAMKRLLYSLSGQALTLALTKAPKADRYLAFAELCEQAAAEARDLASESA